MADCKDSVALEAVDSKLVAGQDKPAVALDSLAVEGTLALEHLRSSSAVGDLKKRNFYCTTFSLTCLSFSLLRLCNSAIFERTLYTKMLTENFSGAAEFEASYRLIENR